MKRTFAILSIIMAVLASCQDEISLNPAASLFSAQPEMTDTTAIFRLAVANVTDSTQAISFPVVFGGTAEPGIDYKVSADAFVFGGESPVDSIVVTALKLGTDKTISMSVQLPEGFEGGKYLTSEFTLHDKFAYISFARDYKMMTDSTDIAFVVTDKSGKTRQAKDSIEVFLSVNTGKSTAVEGADFMFSDSTRFVIRAGATSGALELKSLIPEPVEGMDKIVLNMRFSENFGAGEVSEMEVGMLDGKWKALEGKWLADTLVTDSVYMKKYWEDACSGYDLLSQINRLDEINIDSEFGFDSFFFSTFMYYFKGETQMKKGPVIDLELTDGSIAPVQTFLIGNTNRYFSKTEKSEDQESYIGIRLLPGEEDEQLMDLYVIDHTSRSFMPELEAGGKYATEKPVAASPGLYLNAIFRKE